MKQEENKTAGLMNVLDSITSSSESVSGRWVDECSRLYHQFQM